MKLYGYSPSFEGEVSSSEIFSSDVDFPKFIFLKETDETFGWRTSGWATQIIVESVAEALPIIRSLEIMYAKNDSEAGD